jgi:hypothetical protein
MKVRCAGIISGLAAALMCVSFGLSARAQTSQPTPQSQNPNAFAITAPSTPRKSLQWDASGHWTLNLDMDQPVGRPMDWKDVSAGAYFHITPSMRVGGSFGLGDKFSDPQHLLPEDTTNTPRVRLETKFKF